MPDTNDREKLEETQPQQEEKETAQPVPEEKAAPAPEAQAIAETAVQFPRLEKEDLPPQAQEAIPDIPLEDEELPSLEEDKPEDRGWLYAFVAKMDDKQFRRAQMIFGIVLGALAVLFLMVPLPFGEESATGIGNLWNLVIAMVLVMVVPRTVERKLGGQRILVTQKWMLIVFVAGMLISLGVNLIQGTPVLQQSAASPTPTIAPEVTPTAAP